MFAKLKKNKILIYVFLFIFSIIFDFRKCYFFLIGGNLFFDWKRLIATSPKMKGISL